MAKQEEYFNADIDTCIENCIECHRICLETLQYCLRLGGRHAEPEHIRRLADCADICQTTADFLIRGSELHRETSAVCGEICGRCADDCAALAGNDLQLQECAETCAQCAESCRELAG